MRRENFRGRRDVKLGIVLIPDFIGKEKKLKTEGGNRYDSNYVQDPPPPCNEGICGIWWKAPTGECIPDPSSLDEGISSGAITSRKGEKMSSGSPVVVMVVGNKAGGWRVGVSGTAQIGRSRSCRHTRVWGQEGLGS